MIGTDSSKSPTGADLLAIENDRDTKARLMARLRERQAALQLELASRASQICRDFEEQRDAIEEKHTR